MPFDESPSPVAPLATSRLWSAGTSGGVAVIIMLCLAVLRPDMAPVLGGGAALVALVTWLGIRRSPGLPRGDSPSGESFADPSSAQDTGLLDAVFEDFPGQSGRTRTVSVQVPDDVERNADRTTRPSARSSY